jgi:hypothetical protein
MATKRNTAAGRRVAQPAITRAEFGQVLAAIDDCRRKLDVQFKRFAEMQAELDLIKSAWSRARIRP